RSDADGHGRVADVESVICTGDVREPSKDESRTGHLPGYIREARDEYGMQTFDQHLMDLVADEGVTYETALAASNNPAEFEKQMRSVRRRARTATAAEATPGQ